MRQPGRIARENHGNVEEPRAQPARHDEGVATVVARSRQDDDATAPVSRQLARDFRGCAAGEFHQRQMTMRRFDGAHIGDRIDGGKVRFHGPIIGGAEPGPAGCRGSPCGRRLGNAPGRPGGLDKPAAKP